MARSLAGLLSKQEGLSSAGEAEMPRAGEAGLTEEELQERRIKAMQLRLRGKSYPMIARELKLSVSQAYQDVMHEVRKRSEELKENAEEVRSMEVERLDVIMDKLWDRIEGGSLDHIEVYFKVAHRRAKLLGLDAAGKSEVTINDNRPEHVPDADLYQRVRALQERLAKLPGAKPHPMLLERNPFEALEGEIVGKTAVPTGQAVAQKKAPEGHSEAKRDPEL